MWTYVDEVPEYAESMFLQNVGMYLWVHMALQTRRPTLTIPTTVHLMGIYKTGVCMVTEYNKVFSSNQALSIE
jgi:hypothetical protein